MDGKPISKTADGNVAMFGDNFNDSIRTNRKTYKFFHSLSYSYNK